MGQASDIIQKSRTVATPLKRRPQQLSGCVGGPDADRRKPPAFAPIRAHGAL